MAGPRPTGLLLGHSEADAVSLVLVLLARDRLPTSPALLPLLAHAQRRSRTARARACCPAAAPAGPRSASIADRGVPHSTAHPSPRRRRCIRTAAGSEASTLLPQPAEQCLPASMPSAASHRNARGAQGESLAQLEDAVGSKNYPKNGIAVLYPLTPHSPAIPTPIPAAIADCNALVHDRFANSASDGAGFCLPRLRASRDDSADATGAGAAVTWW